MADSIIRITETEEGKEPVVVYDRTAEESAEYSDSERDEHVLTTGVDITADGISLKQLYEQTGGMPVGTVFGVADEPSPEPRRINFTAPLPCDDADRHPHAAPLGITSSPGNQAALNSLRTDPPLGPQMIVKGPAAAAADQDCPLCPYCYDEQDPPEHTIRCTNKKPETYFIRYYCPTPGCSYSQKLPRSSLKRLTGRPDDENFNAR